MAPTATGGGSRSVISDSWATASGSSARRTSELVASDTAGMPGMAGGSATVSANPLARWRATSWVP